MVAKKIMNFGGMIPAVADRLLPNDHASNSVNTWLYAGELEGIYKFTEVHTLANPNARKVYRIPIEYFDKEHIPDSYWLEFEEPDVDVLKTPIADDSFERFYICGRTVSPSYNTRARIINGDPAFVLGIPGPSVAPKITRELGKYFLGASGGEFTYRGFEASLYYSKGYEVDSDSLGSGGVDDRGFALAGQTRPISSIRGNIDQSITPAPLLTPANLFRIRGQRAELRYTTTIGGQQVTISDTGLITAGVPPSPAPSSVSSGYEGQGVLEYRAYVYTWVSAYGEEGPPSPPGIYVGYSGDPWVVSITPPDTPDTTDRNLDKVRIYRTITGTEGSTAYFLVAELPLATTVYTDEERTVTVAGNQQLQSTFWTAPPTDMAGISLMPNGIMVGFRNNEIWFSEPYRPHAWPAPYVLTVEYPVVGLGVLGQSVVICTTNNPYAATGVNPATMTLTKIPGLEQCLARGSIVSSPSGVAYASPNGVAVAVPGVAQVPTRKLISKDRWQEFLRVPTLRASLVNGAYYTWGSATTGCFEETAFEPTAFEQVDFSGSYAGALIDIEDLRIGYNRLASAMPVLNCFMDAWTGETLLIRDGKVLWLDIAANRDREAYTWRSKVFETPNQRNFGAMRVYFSTYPLTPALNPVRNTSQSQTLAADQYGLVRIYADDRLVVVRELRQSGEIFKLPSGFKATYWEVEIESRVRIHSVEIATETKELMDV
jgi:hypothetical protein